MPRVSNCRLGLCAAHLDDFAASLLQVSHLFPDGQSQLEGLSLAGDVLPWERPVQDGDRPCKQHSWCMSTAAATFLATPAALATVQGYLM